MRWSKQASRKSQCKRRRKKKRKKKSRHFQRALHRPDNVALSLKHTVIFPVYQYRSKFWSPTVLGNSWCKFSCRYSNSSRRPSKFVTCTESDNLTSYLIWPVKELFDEVMPLTPVSPVGSIKRSTPRLITTNDTALNFQILLSTFVSRQCFRVSEHYSQGYHYRPRR